MILNPAYVIRDVLGKTILIPYMQTKNGNCPIHLNDTGRVVVDLLAESSSKDELCHKAAQVYSLDRKSEEFAQVEEFISSLIDMEVIAF